MDKTKMQKLVGFILGIIVFVIVWNVTVDGMSEKAVHATAISLLTAIWWIFMVMPPMIPALFACVLFFVTNTATPAQAFAGFYNPTIWLLFFALVMAKGVETSGLGKRIAIGILSKVPLSYNGLVAAFILLCLVFPFIIPSAAAAVALLMSLAVGILDALGIEKSPNNKVCAGLTCFVGILLLTFGRVPLTGSLPNYIAVGFLNEMAGVNIGWLDWLSIMWIIFPIPAVATYFYVTHFYKPEENLSAQKMKEQIQKSKENLGIITVNEKKAAVFMTLAIVLWACDGIVPLNTNQVGILIGILFLLPNIGFLTMKDFNSMSLVTFFFAGGSFSIGKVLTDTGFAQWAGNYLLKFEFLKDSNLFVAGVFILIFAFVLHFLLETLGEVSLLTPIVLKAGFLPAKAVGILIPYGAGMYLLPYQGSPIVLSLGFNTTGWKDIVHYGCFLTVVSFLQGALFLLTYWKIMFI